MNNLPFNLIEAPRSDRPRIPPIINNLPLDSKAEILPKRKLSDFRIILSSRGLMALGFSHRWIKTVYAQGIIGPIEPPPGVASYLTGGGAIPGLLNFLSNIIKLIITGGGLFTLFNIILAGYSFLSAGGDSKKIEQAWAKIWQSVLGLTIMAGSFVIAIIVGWLLFKDPTAIVRPVIYGPGVSP